MAQLSIDQLDNFSSEELDELLALSLSIHADDCKTSFFEFFKYFWPCLVPDPLVLNWHIKYICDELQIVGERIIKRQPKLYDLIINVPPGSSKSTLVTQMFPAWLWLRDASIRIINTSYSGQLAIEHAVKSRDLLKSGMFKELYGDLIEFKSDMDGKSAYANTAMGARMAVGIGGTITGRHAHVIIADDPINPQMANSDADRLSTNDYMEHTLPSRKVDKEIAVTILVMQRLHEDDPSGRMEKRGNVKLIRIPAEITDLDNVQPKELMLNYTDGIMDTKRMSRESLIDAKTWLGSMQYSCQFLQSPKAAGGNIFKREWFKYYDDLPMGRPIRIIHSWDTAFKKGEDNDESACSVWYEYDNGYYLVDVYSAKLSFPELKAKVESLYNRDKPHYVIIEDKASGTSLIQELSTLNIPIKAINPSDYGGDKEARAAASTPSFESGNVYINRNAEWRNRVEDQLCGFPNTTLKDIVDSITQFINWARDQQRGPFQYAVGQRKSTSLLRGY